MAKVLPLPDGTTVAIREGETPEQTWDRAQRMYPEAFGLQPAEEKAKPESGFTPALKAGFQNLMGDVAALKGRTGITSTEAAEKEIEQRKQRAQEIYKPTEEGWGEAPVTKFKELLGGSAAYMAAPAAAGLAALALPASVPAAVAGAVGTGLAGLTSAAQFTGSNLSRQMDEGKKLADTELGNAALAAVPQAALDMIGLKMIPGVRQIFAMGGKELTEQAAKKIAEQGVKDIIKDYSLSTGKTMGVEGLTEAGQQLFERLQAGLNIADEKARSEYFDNFIGGAVLGGTLSPAGRYVERRKEAGAQQLTADAEARTQAAEAAKIAAAQAKADEQAETARKQTPEYAQSVVDQYDTLQQQKQDLIAQKRKIVEASPTADADRAFNAQLAQQLKELGAQIKPLASEYNRAKGIVDQETEKARQEAEKARIASLTPEEYAAEQAATQQGITVPKQVAPIEGDPFAGVQKQDPITEYVTQRLSLMKEQRPYAEVNDYVDYLMQDPAMARSLVANRITLPDLKPREQNAVLGAMALQFKQSDAQQAAEQAEQAKQQAEQLERVRGQMTGAAPGADIMGAARQAPAVQAAEQQRLAEENRLRVVTPELESLQKLGSTPAYSRADALRQSYETRKGSEQQDEALVQTMMGTLPKGGMITPGQVFQGLGGGTMRERSDLQIQLAVARETRNNEEARAIVEKLRALKQDETAGKGQETAPMQTVLAGVSMPEARAKEAAATKYADLQNEQLLALTRMLGKVNQGTLVLPETFKQRTDAAKQLYFEHHANEINARREAFGLAPMADWERGEARARVMEALNELGDRWGGAANAGTAGQRQFGSQTQAVAALQEQMRNNIQSTVANAAKRANLNSTNDLAEKTGATPAQYYTEDAAGNKKPIEIEQEQPKRRIAPPAELTLREEKKPAPIEDTIQTLLDTADTRQRAVPTAAIKPVKKVGSFADISQLLEKERSAGTLEPMSEGSISLLQKLQEVLPQTTDEEFKTLAGKIVRQIQTGNEPNLFDVRDLNEMSKAMEVAGQSAARPGTSPEELQRTSAQPQLDLFPEAAVQTQRATPRNFQKLLDSKNIQGLREEIEKQRADNQTALEQARDNLPKMQTALEKAQVAYDAALKNIQETTPDKIALEKSNKQESEGITEVLDGLRFTKRNLETRLAEIQALRDGVYAAGESNAMFGTRASIEAANAFRDEADLRKRLETTNEALANAGALQKAIQQMQAGEKPFIEKGEAAAAQAESAFDESKKLLQDAQKTANEERRIAEQKKEPRVEIGTSDAEYKATLQRAREGLNLPGRRNLVDTTAMKQTIINIRRAMGSFDAQLESKDLTEERRADIQAKRDNAAKQLESVYQNAPRITAEIKEDGQLDLERAFDDAQAKAYDQQIAKRRSRTGELTPVLPSKKTGPLVKDTLGAKISQSGERKATPASEAAGTALEKLAEERAKLAELERREKFLRDNGKAKDGGRLTPTFKALQASIEKQKGVVAKAAAEQGKIVSEVKETQKALGSKEVLNLGRKETVGLKEDEASIPKPPKALFRTVTRGPATLETTKVENLVKRITEGWVNAPEIVVVKSEADLPVRIRGQIVREDRAEGTTPGLFDTKTKKVYLIADNLSNANDVVLTVAHEVTGHYGLREMLGGTYNAIMDRLYSGNPAVRKQADAKLKAEPNLTKQVAVEEVLAEMAEQDKPTAEEKSALRQLYERIRAWLRSTLGLTNVSDTEVQQIVANARRYVIEGGTAEEGQAPAGEATYRTKKADYGTKDALSSLAEKVIAKPKTFKERMGNFYALEKEMDFVDMRAGLREALKAGAADLGDTKGFEQAMYNVTKADQKMSLVNASLENGPMELYTDEKGFHGIRSSNKNSAAKVFQAISDIPGGNEQAKVNKATTYMIAQRAANKGLSKLDLGALGVTEAELAAVMSAVNADPALRSALENVRRTYNAYNKGQIDFLASTGAIPKSVAEKLLKDEDYVPYYRVSENGLADLVFGDEVTINIGDIRHQPYLNELKGGETRILPLTESLTRNTMLLMDKAVTNLAAKNVAYAMQSFGEGRGKDGKNLMPIHKGMAPAGSNVIKFNQEPDPKNPKDDGQRWLRVDTDGTVMGGIPPELIVKSLEGAHLTLPTFLKIGGIAGDILRAGVTRTPIYIGRQLVRDPMAASFTGGLNYGPLRAVAKAGKEFIASTRGKSELQKKLIEKGLIQSGIFTGDPDDISKMALQLAGGKNQGAIDGFFAMMDRAAMRADSATRALVYENAIKNGLSEVQADMMTMESMNFYKRGLSPTVQYASRLIPFFNAQIQGLNVLYKAATGQMPYEEQQKIKQKFFNNAMLLVGTGIVYAMAMEDDEYFKNAKPKDKYSNFFIPLPGIDEPFKLPIPYEAGWFFSLAVAAVDAMKAETDGKQQFEALRDMFLQSVPGYSSRGVPQIVKPVFEVWTNKNFYNGSDIESARMQRLTPQERFRASTTEAAKGLSQMLPFLSPIQIEHLATGYFGQLPLVVMAAANGLFAPESKTTAPEGRITDLPLIGSSFQKKYGGADSDVMYRMAEDAMQAKASYTNMLKQGRAAEAKEFLADNRAQIATASMARNYQNMMGKLRSDEERITNMPNMSAAEKRARIDKLDAVRQELASKYEAALKKAEASGRT